MTTTLTLAEPQAIRAIADTHGIVASELERLGSETASTFRLHAGAAEFAVKMQRSDAEQEPLIRWRSEVMASLSMLGHPVPKLISAMDGASVAFTEAGGERISVQVMEWVTASPYGEVQVAPQFGRTLGRDAARLHLSLATLPLPPSPVSHAWDARRMDEQLEAHLALLSDPEILRIGRDALRLYEQRIAPVADELPLALVHQDLHDSNILIDRAGGIAAILDFDDMLVGWRVAEPAIAAGYLARNLTEPPAALREVARAWGEVVPFTEAETAVFAPLAAVRLALNCVVWATRASSDRAAYAGLRVQGSAEAYFALLETVELSAA